MNGGINDDAVGGVGGAAGRGGGTGLEGMGALRQSLVSQSLVCRCAVYSYRMYHSVVVFWVICALELIVYTLESQAPPWTQG